MIQNIVIGKPIVDSWKLISSTKLEFEECDKKETLFTNERFLPKILVEAGITKSTSEVRKNKPELWISLNNIDCFWLKWGKKKIYIIVGE